MLASAARHGHGRPKGGDTEKKLDALAAGFNLVGRRHGDMVDLANHQTGEKKAWAHANTYLMPGTVKSAFQQLGKGVHTLPGEVGIDSTRHGLDDATAGGAIRLILAPHSFSVQPSVTEAGTDYVDTLSNLHPFDFPNEKYQNAAPGDSSPDVPVLRTFYQNAFRNLIKAEYDVLREQVQITLLPQPFSQQEALWCVERLVQRWKIAFSPNIMI